MSSTRNCGRRSSKDFICLRASLRLHLHYVHSELLNTFLNLQKHICQSESNTFSFREYNNMNRMALVYKFETFGGRLGKDNLLSFPDDANENSDTQKTRIIIAYVY